MRWLKRMFRKIYRKVKPLPNDAPEIQSVPFDMPEEGTAAYKLIDEALKHLGIKETRKNYSPRLAELLKDTYWQEPWAWCQFYQGAIGMNALGDKYLHGRGGSTQSTYRRAEERGLTSQTPKVGYQITWQNKNDPAHGHVGLVCAFHPDNKDWIYTIEGNSGNKSKIILRDISKKRTYKKIRGYIMPEYESQD